MLKKRGSPCGARHSCAAGRGLSSPGKGRFLPAQLGRFAMKRLALLSALLISTAGPAFAAEAVAGAAIPDRPTTNVIMIFSTNPAEQCFRTAQDGVDLKFGLEHCNTAMRDPMAIYRAQTVVNRGIIRYDMGDLD